MVTMFWPYHRRLFNPVRVPTRRVEQFVLSATGKRRTRGKPLRRLAVQAQSWRLPCGWHRRRQLLEEV
jgi:hypothetical protein